MTVDKTEKMKRGQRVREGHSGYFHLERRLEKNLEKNETTDKGRKCKQKELLSRQKEDDEDE